MFEVEAFGSVGADRLWGCLVEASGSVSPTSLSGRVAFSRDLGIVLASYATGVFVCSLCVLVVSG